MSYTALFSRKSLIISFITALAVANVSGPQYIYPTYGTSLTNRFHWTPVENSMVSTATFVGVSFSGPLCAWFLENLGFKKTLFTSSITVFIGLFLLAQTYAGYLPGNHILCSIYLAFTGAAGAASYICALDSQGHNFKNNRGMSMGLTSASLGISGLVFSQVNDYFFKTTTSVNDEDDSVYNFLIFMGCTSAAISCIGAFILGPLKEDIQTTESKLSPTQQEEYTRSLIPDYLSSNQSISSFSSSSTRFEQDDERRPLLKNNINASGKHAAEFDDSSDCIFDEESERNISGIAFFTDPIGLASFISLLIMLGIGYVYLANIGEILLSLSDDLAKTEAQHIRNTHISLFSIANCLSRALFGTLSDVLQKRTGVHRLWFFWFAALSLISTLIYLVTSVASVAELIPCTIMTAVAYGILFGVAPAIISEFGTKVRD
ncbi:major facilitator superfamily domain-containing protein [Pilobolus umbonatus]|nr:major facilitator superfamily domain-containing protein [Pilobolus umbonatus]